MVGVGEFTLEVDTCQGMATGPTSPEKVTVLASIMSEDFHAGSLQAVYRQEANSSVPSAVSPSLQKHEGAFFRAAATDR